MTQRGLTRRRMGLLATGAFAASACSFAVSPLLAAGVALPSGAFSLTRRLLRGLRDGKAIIVERSWHVAFAQQSRGIAISGEQTSVSVEAPERLAPIAKIEQDRSTKAMFPILLAPDGTIMAAGENTSQTSFVASIASAQRLLETSGFTKSGAAEQAVYMAQLQKAGSSLLDQLPADLFFPSTAPLREARIVALPNGGSGEFELNWEASVQDGTALLNAARREVITRIGSSERRSSEDWSLTAL
ncbi:MAG: hypothetical protein AAF291_10760 [Pseudomonadota bacterium]